VIYSTYLTVKSKFQYNLVKLIFCDSNDDWIMVDGIISNDSQANDGWIQH
jgi:hypothetical protein